MFFFFSSPRFPSLSVGATRVCVFVYVGVSR